MTDSCIGNVAKLSYVHVIDTVATLKKLPHIRRHHSYIYEVFDCSKHIVFIFNIHKNHYHLIFCKKIF